MFPGQRRRLLKFRLHMGEAETLGQLQPHRAPLGLHLTSSRRQKILIVKYITTEKELSRPLPLVLTIPGHLPHPVAIIISLKC